MEKKEKRIYLFGEQAISVYKGLERKPKTLKGISKAMEKYSFDYMVVEREMTESEHKAYVLGIMDGRKYNRAMLIQ